MSILEAFLLAGPSTLRLAPNQIDWEPGLLACHASAQAAWPEVMVSADEFGAYLGARVPPEADLAAPWEGLRTKELYLACACARGDERAIQLLELHYFSPVVTAFARMRLSPNQTQEIRQTLRTQLFVRSDEQGPRIAAYAGRGDLGSWLSVSAVRAAYKLLHKEKRTISDDDEQLAQLPGTNLDAELSYIKDRCRRVFRESFAAALSLLGPRERTLLRQHYLDALTLEQIAALYGTHRATAARWLAAARSTLLGHTRAALRQRLGAPQQECDSIIRTAQSQFDMTLNSLFAIDSLHS